MALVWLHGIDDAALDSAEWWRVRALQGTCGARVRLVNEVVANYLARVLVADCCETVLVEHWRDGERISARLVGRVS